MVSLSMQKLLLITLLFLAQFAFAQKGFLNVKKKSFKKVRTFEEGSTIRFETKNGSIIYGGLALVRKDSIYVNGNWFAAKDIGRIILRERGKYRFDPPIFLWTTAGVVLSTAGMTLAKWSSFNKSLQYSAGIGYGNFLITHFPKLKRKQYKMGKKFSVQTFDLHF
jgi:hypothetical protein